MSLEKIKVTATEPLPEREGRWIRLVKLTWQDPNGTTRSWESAERTTRPSTTDIDGVGVVAILQDAAAGPSIVLQRQFRPPINRISIELPAGLIDADETPECAAERELLEETGYVGVATETTFVMFNDPGFCNTNLRMVHVSVDMSLPENKHPTPRLEQDEFIEVFVVPLAGLWAECKRLADEGFAIDGRVGTLAEGIELARRMLPK